MYKTGRKVYGRRPPPRNRAPSAGVGGNVEKDRARYLIVSAASHARAPSCLLYTPRPRALRIYIYGYIVSHGVRPRLVCGSFPACTCATLARQPSDREGQFPCSLASLRSALPPPSSSPLEAREREREREKGIRGKRRWEIERKELEGGDKARCQEKERGRVRFRGGKELENEPRLLRTWTARVEDRWEEGKLKKKWVINEAQGAVVARWISKDKRLGRNERGEVEIDKHDRRNYIWKGVRYEMEQVLKAARWELRASGKII